MVGKCEFYLPKKKRRCNFLAKPGFAYCGNHMPNSLQPDRKRIPCPWDPAHTIFESEQAQHAYRCPTHLLQLESQAQQYCQPDVNAGSVDDALHQLAGQTPTAGEPPQSAGRLQRQEYVQAMGHERFAALTQRIHQACQQVCSAHELLQQLCPAECTAYLQADNARPFSLKHAQQQASIVGHMKQSGLLELAKDRFYIEFGAGKGYLSSMLADASDAKHFVLMDVRSFRNKAERSLRKVDDLQLQRLRVDIKDFQPEGVQGLQGGSTPWVATGKHLCGAATDFTLRCCASSLQNPASSGRPSHATTGTQPASEQATAMAQPDASVQPTTSHLDARAQTGCEQGIQGLAVATCCHHRCSWQHYVGKPLFRQLGFGPDEFEVISWMTGWALCGHETPAGEAGQEVDGRAAASQGEDGAEPLQHRAQAAVTTSDCGVAERCVSCNQSESGVSCNQSAPSAQAQQTILLTRPERIALGSKCKRLIDKGRELWLLEQGFQVQSVLYINAKISGENRLLLAVRKQAS